MMTAKCGSCGKTHDTILEYKACFGLGKEADAAGEKLDELTGSDRVVNRPSDRQITYVADLLAIHDWPDEVTEGDLRAMDRSQVSALITRIKNRPLKRQVPDGQPADGRSPRPQYKPSEFVGTADKKLYHTVPPGTVPAGPHLGRWGECTVCNTVPAGRYALYRKSDDSWVFYQVERPAEGQWAGYVFVKLLIGAPGSYRQERCRRDVKAKVLARIEEVTARQASIDYGIKSETCGVCHSPLSNKESLDRGIGPVCASKMGW